MEVLDSQKYKLTYVNDLKQNINYNEIQNFITTLDNLEIEPTMFKYCFYDQIKNKYFFKFEHNFLYFEELKSKIETNFLIFLI